MRSEEERWFATTMTSLAYLPDSLLQIIHSYLDEYNQRVFLVLNSKFAQLGEVISIINIPIATFLKNLRSKRWTNIANGYDRINMNFCFQYFDEINGFRGWIIRSYQKRMEEEAREGRQLPGPSERLYEMVMEMWPFTSLQNLVIDLNNGVYLLEENKLLMLQKLSVSCDADLGKEEIEDSATRLFGLLKNNRLQLKELEIIRDSNVEVMESMPRFPSFSTINGLLNLCVQGFIIPKNPGDGFKSLKQLVLDCVLDCDVSPFDGVDRLILKFCRGVRKLSALKITRNVHISGFLTSEDRFYEASHLELEISEEMNEPITLTKYENAQTLSLSGWTDTTLIMPEKLSNKLKDLHIDCFAPLEDLLPPNNLKFIELANMNPEHLLPSFSNIEYVRFSQCPSFSLESLGSGIKDITITACSVVDYSPLGRYEKISIQGCDIPHTLKLSEVKELTIHDCKFYLNEELNGLLLPFLADCPKLEVLDVDFSYFNRYDMKAIVFPSLKKIVLRGVDAENVDMDIFSFSGFRKCLMPQRSLRDLPITYLLRQ